MEKYAVQIDPKKLKSEKEKLAGENAGSVDNPDVNVPMDPEKGTEPYEKESNGKGK